MSSYFRDGFSSNLNIVTLFEVLCHDKSLDLDFIQTISELICLKCWIDINQNQVGSEACVSCQQPFTYVWSVHTHSIPFLVTHADQGLRYFCHSLVKLRISPSNMKRSTSRSPAKRLQKYRFCAFTPAGKASN